MKIIFTLLIVLANTGLLFAQGLHGTIRRKPNVNVSKPKKKKAETNKSTSFLRTIPYPKVNSFSDDAAGIIIQSVSFANNYVAFKMKMNTDTWEWVNINKNTYLNVSGKKLKIIDARNIKFSPHKTSLYKNGVKLDEITFILIFPPMPLNTTAVDLIEPGENGWKYYGIELSN